MGNKGLVSQRNGQVSSPGAIGQVKNTDRCRVQVLLDSHRVDCQSKTKTGVWCRCTRQSETETGMESLAKGADRCRM